MTMKNFATKLVRSFKRSILRDEFLLAHKRWRKTKGDQTLRFDYDLDDTSVVLDVGGFEGNFAHDIHDRFRCKVFVFEPSAAYADGCKQRFQTCEDITILQYGLSDSNETVLLSADGDGSSVFRETGDDSQSVVLRSVEDVLAELQIEKIDLMKINIEGGEFPLLQSMIERGLIDRVRFLQVQFHDFVPNARAKRADIRDALAKTHKEQWCFPFVWESWERQ